MSGIRAGRTAESGFTLLEMLLVLGLLALMAGLAMPLARRQSTETGLKTTALQLVSLMRSARGAAIRDNAEKTLVLDGAGRRFRVAGLTASRPIGAGIEARLAAPMRFFADGSASGGKAILTAGAEVAEIRLDALTGQPRLRWRP